MEGKDTRRQTLSLWLFMVAFVGLSASSIFAQSLVDVANKEKERRSKLGQQEQAQVITDRELQTSGRLPETLPTSTSSSGAENAASTSQSGEEGGGEEESEETGTREHWQSRVEAVKKKIADLEAKLQDPDNDWGGGLRQDVNPIGQRNLSQRQEVEGELAQAKAELRGIQNEARRAGVPPGWVR